MQTNTATVIISAFILAFIAGFAGWYFAMNQEAQAPEPAIEVNLGDQRGSQ